LFFRIIFRGSGRCFNIGCIAAPPSGFAPGGGLGLGWSSSLGEPAAQWETGRQGLAWPEDLQFLRREVGVFGMEALVRLNG